MAFLKDFASAALTAGGDYLAEEDQLKKLLKRSGKGTPDEYITTGEGIPGVQRRQVGGDSLDFLTQQAKDGSMDIEELIKLIMSVGK